MADVVKPRINIITFGVKNLPMMREFYEGLGLHAASTSNDQIVFFNLSGVVLALFDHQRLAEDAEVQHEPMQGYRGVTVAWNAHNQQQVDEIMGHAAKSGAKILKAPKEVFWGGYSGYFADPENNLWEVAHNPLIPLDDEGRLLLS
jgi:uncharacterized protein